MKPDITLIFPSSPFLLDQAVFPPLGILYLSAFLKQYGFKVQCLDMGMGHTLDMVKSNIVGVSFSTPQRDEAFKIADYFMGKKWLIAGGPHPTHMADECYEAGFQKVIKGYGEIGLLKVLNLLLSKGLEIPEIKSIDSFPFPDRNALPVLDYHYSIDGMPATPIMTTRGCYEKCAFCARIEKGCEIQSAERTIDEINHLHETYGFEAFMIFDDIFIASKKRLKKIADALEGKFKFRCFGRANLITDEVCKDMVRLGVVEVGIGVESGSDEILKLNMKGTSRRVNLNAFKMLKEYGIRAKAFLIVGLPGETPHTIADTESWVMEAKPYDVDFSVFQPLPGSAIFEEPEMFGVSFDYDGIPGWYKGTPGQYKPMASTGALSPEKIVFYRELLENKFKKSELLR